MSNILVVDDEPAICWGIKQLLEREGHRVTILASGEEALKSVVKEKPDLLLMDVRLPGICGLEALDKVRAIHPELPIVIMTAFGQLDIAVEVMRHPGVDYLAKPFDLDQVASVVQRMLQDGSTVSPEKPADTTSLNQELLGRTPVMQALFKQIALTSASDLPVLITGESGTGKELVAHWIHQHSGRAAQPYIPIAPIALSPALFESEMFGHVKGAFTGAVDSRVGVFGRVNGGTVMLDEIGDLPLEQQIKLLRVLELKQYTPVGDTQSRACDARIISATNRDLFRAIEEGRFREDLYFRLAGMHIHLPPLRERVEDIELLVTHFLKRLGVTEPESRLTPELLLELRRRPWRGNVRELRNTIEHAFLMSRGRPLRPEHLPMTANYQMTTNVRVDSTLPGPATLPLDVTGLSEAQLADKLAELVHAWLAVAFRNPDAATNLYEKLLAIIEPPVLRLLLEKHHGNKSALATQLGWHRATVRRRLQQYKLDDGEA
ncbi:MAG: sigma-54-dependent Fis family transcriptional regulator [Pirellulaceae bacterium]|nr:sigma-54-dependent Fis family transcriptional regulator [Pirellulaceae bacterium]